MLDGASAISAALQGNARREGWGGFVEVADAPGWAVGSRSGVLLSMVF